MLVNDAFYVCAVPAKDNPDLSIVQEKNAVAIHHEFNHDVPVRSLHVIPTFALCLIHTREYTSRMENRATFCS